LGPIRDDVNVVWDLASHDVSIFSYLLGSQPVRGAASGQGYLREDIEDVASISLAYPGKVTAYVHISWMDPRKIREITVVGSKKMMVWSDLDTTSPLRLYDRGVKKKGFKFLPRQGEETIVKPELAEPLKVQGLHFLECVEERKEPVGGGSFALKVVEVLSALQRSMDNGGKVFEM
jgi:predicted dehydrogenase